MTMPRYVCNICGRDSDEFCDVHVAIQENSSVRSIISGHLFCALCADPIIRFLKRQGFVQLSKTIAV